MSIWTSFLFVKIYSELFEPSTDPSLLSSIIIFESHSNFISPYLLNHSLSFHTIFAFLQSFSLKAIFNFQFIYLFILALFLIFIADFQARRFYQNFDKFLHFYLEFKALTPRCSFPDYALFLRTRLMTTEDAPCLMTFFFCFRFRC